MSKVEQRLPPQGLVGLEVHGPAWQTDRTRTLFVEAPNPPEHPKDSNYWVDGLYHGGIRLVDAAATVSHLGFMMPADFVSLNTIIPVIGPEGTGNLSWQIAAFFCAAGEALNTHTAGVVGLITAVTTSRINELPDLVTILEAAVPNLFDNLTANDFVDLRLTRLGADGADTINADVILLGYIVSYEADM